ncbi:M23 family metallopeptidase [Sinomonas sp. JGH33]|uniref:M23 family metallopeptidase n=1 Tax=Sinomonas terricola TaxID=3110330 RepID=A0ABU5T5X5_9MICC|nr:M23 family metallopeptidase [Sinomonas sp. JGH33]MEA5454970.1 M23 family metallopeptidase [Sinomonas sp. JGH33]
MAAVSSLAVSVAPAFADAGVGTDSVRADPNAVIVFEHADVSSIPAGTHSGVVLTASTDLPRPPQGKLYAPLESLVPSSPFGYRIDPLTGQPGEFHWGQDFAAACGTRVYAADAGVVRAAGWHPWGGGNRVEIDHGNGLVTTYNHMLDAAVKVGDTVAVGQVVGLVGSTGDSTGCHLHFETILNGVYKDPMQWSFIPIAQRNPVTDLTLTDYTPSDGKAPSGQNWDIPGLVSEPAPGETVRKAPAPAPAPTPPPSAPSSPPPTPTPSPSSSPTPSPTPTSPSPTPSPSDSPTPTPTPTASSSTLLSSSPTPTPTPAPTPTPTATQSTSTSPSPSPTSSSTTGH